jgi:hypothetical protein
MNRNTLYQEITDYANYSQKEDINQVENIENVNRLFADMKTHLINSIKEKKPSLADLITFIALHNHIKDRLQNIANKNEGFNAALAAQQQQLEGKKLSDNIKLEGGKYLKQVEKEKDTQL